MQVHSEASSDGCAETGGRPWCVLTDAVCLSVDRNIATSYLISSGVPITLVKDHFKESWWLTVLGEDKGSSESFFLANSEVKPGTWGEVCSLCCQSASCQGSGNTTAAAFLSRCEVRSLLLVLSDSKLSGKWYTYSLTSCPDVRWSQALCWEIFCPCCQGSSISLQTDSM